MDSFLEAFTAIDKDCSKAISTDELNAYMRGNGADISFVQKWQRLFDPDGSGQITLQKFCEVLGIEASELGPGYGNRSQSAELLDERDFRIISADMSKILRDKVMAILSEVQSQYPDNTQEVVKFLKKALDSRLGVETVMCDKWKCWDAVDDVLEVERLYETTKEQEKGKPPTEEDLLLEREDNWIEFLQCCCTCGMDFDALGDDLESVKKNLEELEDDMRDAENELKKKVPHLFTNMSEEERRKLLRFSNSSVTSMDHEPETPLVVRDEIAQPEPEQGLLPADTGPDHEPLEGAVGGVGVSGPKVYTAQPVPTEYPHQPSAPETSGRKPANAVDLTQDSASKEPNEATKPNLPDMKHSKSAAKTILAQTPPRPRPDQQQEPKVKVLSSEDQYDLTLS